MDFELATMLAESGLTFQEFRQRGLTKSQLRVSLGKDEEDADQEAKQDSVFQVGEKRKPNPVRTAPQGKRAAASPASIPLAAVPVTPKEPESLLAELTDEMAATVLVQMSREGRLPQAAKRQCLENGYGYVHVDGPSTSYSYAQTPQYPYYEQPGYLSGHGHMPHPGHPAYQPYQAYHAFPGYHPYPYQQQPYQQAPCDHGYHYTQPQVYAAAAEQGVHPQYQGAYQGAYQGQAPSQIPLQRPIEAVLQDQRTSPSSSAHDAEADTKVTGSVALVSTDNVNIKIANDTNRTNEQRWINHYNRLQDYLVEHGSYPTHSKAQPCMLGQWCGRQRKHFRRMGPYKYSSIMPAHRVELMELLPGWRWEGAPNQVSIKSWTPIRGLKLPESFWRR